MSEFGLADEEQLSVFCLKKTAAKVENQHFVRILPTLEGSLLNAYKPDGSEYTLQVEQYQVF